MDGMVGRQEEREDYMDQEDAVASIKDDGSFSISKRMIEKGE